ncbi:NUDIX hydrolase [uncultured Shimia sp.]|uniref:NUDIX hydrolase n=1 Tax=uncultured Shimia sp. TaxID=573152 RepID=UPI00260E167E|nr:NUDIX hydrolase [uncultured Shimia sp.]
MTLHLPKQKPIRLRKARKTDLRTQFGALVYRVRDGKTQVLMITTRRTKSWSIPKGWPMSGKTPAAAAAQEAWEEAGVKGTVFEQPAGFYTYVKLIETRRGMKKLPVFVSVYPLAVRKVTSAYPEAHERRRKWMSPKKAADRVREPELAQILRNFDAESLS